MSDNSLGQREKDKARQEEAFKAAQDKAAAEGTEQPIDLKGIVARGTPKIDFSKPLDTSVVRGKTALVTGGASGLGYAIVKALAQAGAKVAICDLNEENGKRVESVLSGEGLKVKFIAMNATSWDSQLSAFKETLSWSGNKLDIVLLAAGVGANSIAKWAKPEEQSAGADPPKPSITTLEVNLIGVYYSMDLALFYFNQLADQQQGFKPQLVFIASLAGYGELALSADYCASKFGVRAIWKTLRKSMHEFGNVQTNLLAPTYIETPMTADFVPLLKEAGMKVGVPGDVVAGAMRAICDPDVEGRAIATCAGDEGKPGSANFDLLDDLYDHDGGKALFEQCMAGVLGPVFG